MKHNGEPPVLVCSWLSGVQSLWQHLVSDLLAISPGPDWGSNQGRPTLRALKRPGGFDGWHDITGQTVRGITQHMFHPNTCSNVYCKVTHLTYRVATLRWTFDWRWLSFREIHTTWYNMYPVLGINVIYHLDRQIGFQVTWEVNYYQDAFTENLYVAILQEAKTSKCSHIHVYSILYRDTDAQLYWPDPTTDWETWQKLDLHLPDKHWQQAYYLVQHGLKGTDQCHCFYP